MIKTTKALIIATIFSAGITLSGCASPESNDLNEIPTSQVKPSPEAADSRITIPAEVVLPKGSDALGVVTAAILITAGDVEEAIASGQVTPSEVKYANLAIEEGTLNQWREIAEEASK